LKKGLSAVRSNLSFLFLLKIQNLKLYMHPYTAQDPQFYKNSPTPPSVLIKIAINGRIKPSSGGKIIIMKLKLKIFSFTKHIEA
jgi:hypothetical protein